MRINKEKVLQREFNTAMTDALKAALGACEAETEDECRLQMDMYDVCKNYAIMCVEELYKVQQEKRLPLRKKLAKKLEVLKTKKH